MSERFIEVNIHEGGGHVCTGTIDLESVILFKKQHAGWIKVLLSTSGLWEIEVGYDAFKKLHSDYHASKQPVSIVSQWSLPPSDLPMGKLTTTSTGEWTELPPTTGEFTTCMSDEPSSSKDKGYIGVDILRAHGHAVVVVFPEDLRGADPRKIEEALLLGVEDEVDDCLHNSDTQ